MNRPVEHEIWCDEWVWHDDHCVCDLELRQAKWDRENRTSNAAPLPRAVARKRSK